MHYIEISQEVTDESVNTLVYYLAQQTTVIPCMDGLFNAHFYN